MSVRKIDFLIAGAQKGGTTSLDLYLRSSAQLAFPNVKELHLFDVEQNIRHGKISNKVIDLAYKDSGSGMRGESTPITLYLDHIHPIIHRYNPRMKFILMLRNPADRAFSHWKMNNRRGVETLSFSEAIRAGRIRVLDDSEFNGKSRDFSYVERGFYYRQISSLVRLFGFDSVLLIKTDDLERDLTRTIFRICDFLSIDRFVPANTIWSNSGDNDNKMSFNDRKYLNALFLSDMMKLKSEFNIAFGGVDIP